jgi:hypothetical protein
MTINIKVEKHIYKCFSIFKIFYIYLKVHCQGCQNNPLSTDPFSYICGINTMNDIFLIHLCDDYYKLFNTSIFSITHEIDIK